MNIEIKAILDKLKNNADKHLSNPLNNCKEYQDYVLYDYITNLQTKNEYLETWNSEIKLQLDNLQQENETLHENNRNMQEEMARTWKKCDDYKSRCEKAIEYINNTIEDKPLTDFDCGSNNACNDLLNILQNGSENNE